MAYKALARASVTIELFEDNERYEATVVSTNGVILQPYDSSTTLIGSVLKNGVDITSEIKNVRWTKWNPTADNLVECPEWNEKRIGYKVIEVKKDDVDNKSIFSFEAYNDNGDLLCTASISIIDINDLLVSTKEPENPYIGQLWVDDSKSPANLYVWNGYKWVISGSIGVVVNNLLYNTGFTYNMDKWEIVGEKRLIYTPTPHTHLERRYLTMNSEVTADAARGITQTTAEEIVKDSDYSFQMLFYSSADTMIYSNNIIVNIYSVDSHNTETLIGERFFPAEKMVQKLFFTFRSKHNTEHFRVEILGESGKRFNFNIAEPAIYNTHNRYPWTPNAKDSTSMLTQENVWNALSNYGTVQGITSIRNELTGQLEYYINASMINAGKISAQYLDVYNLSVTRKDNPDIKTLEITDDGIINITVKELRIGIEEPTNIEDYVGGEVGAATDVLNNKISEATNTLDDKINEASSALDGKINEATSTLDDKIDTATSSLKSNIDAANRSINETKTEVIATIEGVAQRVTNSEAQTESLVQLTKDGVYLSAYENGKHSLVDMNGNNVTIKSNNITLEGYTTINDKFTVNTDGTIYAEDGHFSGTISASEIVSQKDSNGDYVFSLDKTGLLIAKNALISGQVGGTVAKEDIISTSSGKFMLDGDTGIMTCREAGLTDCIIQDGTINIKNNFIVTADGKVYIKGFTGDDGVPDIGGGRFNNARIKKSSFEEGTISDSTIEDCTIKNESESLLINKDGSIKSTSLNTGDISAANITASGNITSTGIITGGSLKTSDKIEGKSLIISENIEAKNIKATEGMETVNLKITGSLDIGDIETEGAIKAGSFTTAGNLSAKDISAANITLTDKVKTAKLEVTESISFAGDLSIANLTAGEKVTAKNIETTEKVKAASIEATNAITGKSLEVTETIKGASLETTDTIKGKSLEITEGIKGKTIEAESFSATDSITVTNNISHSDKIIYKGESNTFIADHYAIGEEAKVVGELDKNVLKLGQGMIMGGVATIEKLEENKFVTLEIKFETAFSVEPAVTITLQSEEPGTIFGSVSKVTKEGFTLNCIGPADANAVFHWIAAGAS